MKVKLTSKWKQLPYSSLSNAVWGSIRLRCDYSWYTTRPSANVGSRMLKRWVGEASILCPSCNKHTNIIGTSYSRVGPRRTSIKLARRDAEKLAVELLRDFRDGTKNLMKYYNMDEDD